MNIESYLDESISLTGVLVRPSSLEGYVNLFFTMLSQVSKAYKKQSDTQKYQEGCGKVFDASSKGKINRDRISYTLLDEIVLSKRKIYYTLQLDIDSQNVIIQYRQYKNKTLRNKYLAIVLAKKNIIQNLKNAGFSVKSDSTYIYASTDNYIKNPSEVVINGERKNFGNLIMNDYQKETYKVAKELFDFEEVYPGFNKYSIKLINAKCKNELSDENKLHVFIAGTLFEKIILVSNGSIKILQETPDGPSSIVLTGAFPQIKIGE